MVIKGMEAGIDVRCRCAVGEDVVSGLKGEGLLYFGIRGNEEMKKNQSWQNERQKNV